jgi:tRNA(fMet)-specific endonuclease VapC
MNLFQNLNGPLTISHFLKGDLMVVRHFEEYLDYFDLIEISLNTYYEIISGLLAKNALKQLAVF